MLDDGLKVANQRLRTSSARWVSAGKRPALSPAGCAGLRLKPLTHLSGSWSGSGSLRDEA